MGDQAEGILAIVKQLIPLITLIIYVILIRIFSKETSFSGQKSSIVFGITSVGQCLYEIDTVSFLILIIDLLDFRWLLACCQLLVIVVSLGF